MSLETSETSLGIFSENFDQKQSEMSLMSLETSEMSLETSETLFLYFSFFSPKQSETSLMSLETSQMSLETSARQMSLETSHNTYFVMQKMPTTLIFHRFHKLQHLFRPQKKGRCL